MPPNSAAIIQAELSISGRVQGVNFRSAVVNWSRHLGITGFVANLPDGTVYVLAQGTSQQLEELKQKCYAGPERAQVHQVNLKLTPLTDHYQSFTIKYKTP